MLAVVADVALVATQRILTPWTKPADVRRVVETVTPAAMAGA
jgi:hypothetical protein